MIGEDGTVEALLSPKVDFVFKRIFGTEDNRDVLLAFLNAIFEDSEQPLVDSVEILNPFVEKDALTDKMSVLDVKARTAAGMLIDIEIQVRDHQDMAKRTLFYWSQLFQQQLKVGDDYHQLHKTVTVNVLDFTALPDTPYHSTFHLHEDRTGRLLTDLLEVHYIELRKLYAQSLGLERRLVRWMLFLTTQTRERLEELAMADPALKKALTTLEWLSQDAHTRELYEARQKGLMTYQADLAGAREQGRQEGRAEGREEGREEGRAEGREEGRAEGAQRKAVEVARYLLTRGIAVDEVAQATGLPVTDIAALTRTLP
ncbi:MAG: hypothetical protein C7B45_06705 [Sulfobacillus acidophilus]|uniref:Transposase n=1 Tax=Sulfobacillus acidophilus TaxID=53633 RepID=A0A2T2WJU1_9FIRM|nr:MAG: hypothetical protein C7B45_06705 [Sulfobacillus acidophilus]